VPPDPRTVAWLAQAESDHRTAQRLEAMAGRREALRPMEDDDLGCHVAAMCAQCAEKTIKALYAREFGRDPPATHRFDRLGSVLARSTGVATVLRGLPVPVRARLRALCALSPGAGPGPANTEYPWSDGRGGWVTPAGAAPFADPAIRRQWIVDAGRLLAAIRRALA